MSTRPPMALWNGELKPLAEVRIAPLDRGYLFGDAVYEVLRLYGGKPFLLEPHARRLARSLRELGIAAPAGALGEKIDRLVQAQELKGGALDCGVYVQVSRGEAPRVHVPPPGLTPNELIFLLELPHASLAEKNAKGISICLQPDQRWGRCDIKSTNLLGNILAAKAAKDGGFDEAALVGEDGYITEGAHTTFFGVVGGKLLTTPLSPSILPGITRDFVIEAARGMGVEVVEKPVHSHHVGRLDEAFLTGTVSEIFPIVRIGDRRVGDGSPGPVTRRLQGAYKEALPK